MPRFSIARILTAAVLIHPLTALAADGEKNGPLEEVTVTAQFKAEALQTTPLAISAISGEKLEERSLSDVTQLDAMVPNTVIAPLGAGYGSTVAAFIRGIGLGDNSLSFEPGVPIYVDDVYNGRPQGAILDLLDLERVEVLRGPQGTLFGKNAIGGAVRLISKKPQGDNSGSVEATVGSFNRLDMRGTWDIPLVKDVLFARFAVSSKRRDGYFDLLDFECVNGAGSLGAGGTGGVGVSAGTPPIRLGSQVGLTDGRNCVTGHLGGENVQSARAAFRLIASESVELNVVTDYTEQNQEGPSDKYTVINGAVGLNTSWSNQVGLPVFGVPYDSRFLTNDPYTGYQRFGTDPLTGRDYPNQNNLEHWGVAGTVDWDMASNMHVKLISAYREFENAFGRDSDGSPLPFNPTFDTTNHRQFSEELQVTGTAFERLDWAAGGFYYDARDSNQGYVMLAPLLNQMQDSRDVQYVDSWATFAHVVYHWTDKLSTTVGLRYTDDRKDVTIFRRNFNGTVSIPGTNIALAATRTSPKLGIDYQWTDELMTYALFSTGFRGGGFGPRPSNALQVSSFEPEDLDNYEIGAKSEWFDGRMRLNGAVFYSEYTNQQQARQDCAPCTPVRVPWFRTVNTGSSTIKGVEAEFQARPFERLQLEGSLGYIDYFRDDPGLSGLCQYLPNGDPCYPNRTPKWNYGFGIQYSVPLGSVGGTLTPRVDWTSQSRIYFNDAIGTQAGYSLINARLMWVASDETWSAALSGTNLTDEVYFNGKLSLTTSLGREQGNVAAPRQWGLSIKRKF
jgi:iron complex outermembrane receptor protein